MNEQIDPIVKEINLEIIKLLESRRRLMPKDVEAYLEIGKSYWNNEASMNLEEIENIRVEIWGVVEKYRQESFEGSENFEMISNAVICPFYPDRFQEDAFEGLFFLERLFTAIDKNRREAATKILQEPVARSTRSPRIKKILDTFRVD